MKSKAATGLVVVTCLLGFFASASLTGSPLTDSELTEECRMVQASTGLPARFSDLGCQVLRDGRWEEYDGMECIRRTIRGGH
jgi:hypothetical protein